MTQRDDTQRLGHKESVDNSLRSSNADDVKIAFIKARTRLAITLAIGGILALVIGIAVLFELIGENPSISCSADTTVPDTPPLLFWALVVVAFLVISIIWGFLSYTCLRSYKSMFGAVTDTTHSKSS